MCWKITLFSKKSLPGKRNQPFIYYDANILF